MFAKRYRFLIAFLLFIAGSSITWTAPRSA